MRIDAPCIVFVETHHHCCWICPVSVFVTDTAADKYTHLMSLSVNTHTSSMTFQFSILKSMPNVLLFHVANLKFFGLL